MRSTAGVSRTPIQGSPKDRSSSCRTPHYRRRSWHLPAATASKYLRNASRRVCSPHSRSILSACGIPVHGKSDCDLRSVRAIISRISDTDHTFPRSLEVQRYPIREDHVHFHAVSFLEDLSEERHDRIAVLPQTFDGAAYGPGGALASGPYSARTISLSKSRSERLTDNPVISTELTTNATVSAATESPRCLFGLSNASIDPVSQNTDLTRALSPTARSHHRSASVCLHAVCP